MENGFREKKGKGDARERKGACAARNAKRITCPLGEKKKSGVVIRLDDPQRTHEDRKTRMGGRDA